MRQSVIPMLVRLLLCASLFLSRNACGEATTEPATRALIGDCIETSPSLAWVPPDYEFSPYNSGHHSGFSNRAPKYNQLILSAIDQLQEKWPTGGGYGSGVMRDRLLFGEHVLYGGGRTSYCTGATYTVLIKAIEKGYPEIGVSLDKKQAKLFEIGWPDGEAFWGRWNDNGDGMSSALSYYQCGVGVEPEDALPGDFVKIYWDAENWRENVGTSKEQGHAAVFLGWVPAAGGRTDMLFWSSQKKTNGYGDRIEAYGYTTDDKKTIVKATFCRMGNPLYLLKALEQEGGSILDH